ncbi:AP endonuclease [Pholiota conissans]|uniref:Apurinic-apyrimidinic endonuclease 1 n=1 Tax=Pholiota conissans TaxID=109636 RepID=A0A9P5YWH1_9AGAR|nr:AP endonuclease [Pholiota conissans]
MLSSTLTRFSGRNSISSGIGLINTLMPTTRRSTRVAHHDVEPPTKKTKGNDAHTIATNGAAANLDPSHHTEHTDSTSSNQAKTVKWKGKGKAKESEVDSSAFLERVDSQWLVGAHVSAAKGVENAIINAASIGANAFALFLKSQRKWTSPPLTDTSIAEFKKRMKEYRYTSKMVLPHGSYLINLGNPDADKREKSYTCFVDDLKRCQELGLELYNFHPGSTVGQATTKESLAFIAECINRAHKETEGVTAVLENMAGAGNIIGSDFSHLAGIIELVEDKSRVGVCIDTCHTFAAGYDIRTKEGWNNTMKAFDEMIGLKYLRGMHLNDSKTDYNSKKDRHENIGLGYLGLPAFNHILSDPRTQGIPLILETPSFEQPAEVWGKEIEVLQLMCGQHTHSPSQAEESGLDFGGFVSQIKSAVKDAEKNGKGPKGKAQKTKGSGGKRKRGNAAQDDEGDDDDDGSDC